MTNLDRIRRLSAVEMADALEKWIIRCSVNCPALTECRNGISCHQAILAWLIHEEEQ